MFEIEEIPYSKKIRDCQLKIDELEKLIDVVNYSENDVTFKIETKHLFDWGDEIHSGKSKHKLPLSKEVMKDILKLAISNEEAEINKIYKEIKEVKNDIIGL